MSSRLGTFQLVEMDGCHEVLFTRPAELAEKLIEASSEEFRQKERFSGVSFSRQPLIDPSVCATYHERDS